VNLVFFVKVGRSK